jgi:hypothetical protein
MQNQDVHPFFNFQLSDMYPDYDDYEVDLVDEEDDEDDDNRDEEEEDEDEDADKDKDVDEKDGDGTETDYIGFGDPPPSIIHPSSSKDLNESHSNLISSTMSEEIDDRTESVVTPHSQTGEGVLDWKKSLRRSVGKQTGKAEMEEAQGSLSALSPRSANIYQKFLSDYPKAAMEEYFYDSERDGEKESDGGNDTEDEEEEEEESEEEESEDEEEEEEETYETVETGQSVRKGEKPKTKPGPDWKIC